MLHKKTYVIACLFIMHMMSIYAQELKPKGVFLSDSIKIGEKVGYALSIKYPKNMRITFPDSSYDFTPFEFINKTYFKTVSDSTSSMDSAIYFLTSYEVDRVQSLSLPVFILLQDDSTRIYSTIDTILLSSAVTVLPDSVALKENIQFQETPQDFNYPYFAIAVGAIILLCLVIFFVFGKSIRQKIQKYRLKRAHHRFLHTFSSLIEQVHDELSAEEVEKLLVLWKTYMEKITHTPYKKLTTKEIIAADGNEALKESLRNIDRCIYSTSAIEKESIIRSLEEIRAFAIKKYQEKPDSYV